MKTDILTKPWVVAPAAKPRRAADAHDCDGQPVVWLRGKDYPHLCDTCRAAISQAADILPEIGPWGRWYDPSDPEVAFMFAYDHAWLCGGHECDCVPEPEVEIVAAMTVQSTTFRAGWVVVDEQWVILPLYGNGYDLGQLAREMAETIGDRARLRGYEIVTVVDHPDGTWSEVVFEVIFDEKTALEPLWQVTGYRPEDIHEIC